MRVRDIPKVVREVYAHNGIPEEEWEEHYEMDLNDLGRLKPEAKQVYETIMNDIRRMQ